MFSPHPDPQFGAAARTLVRTLEAESHIADRAVALGQVIRELGDNWYPMYLKVLMVIGEGAPTPARALVADAVAHGLQHGTPLGGTLSAWGMPAQQVPPAAMAALGRGFLRMAAGRALDPLAYFAVWASQSTSRQPLPQEAFERALRALLNLFDASPAAAAIYQAKLRADLLAPPAGAFSALTIRRLQCLQDGWTQRIGAAELAARVARVDLPAESLAQLRVVPGRRL
jgi:hypothetical protein